MADEEVGISLEDDAPVAAPVAAVVEPPAAEAAPAEDEDEGIAQVVAGEKLVPLTALKAERQQRQALEPLKAEVEQLRQQAAQAAPYVQFLQAHPELLQRQAPQPPATPLAPNPAEDPEALEVARELDFYTPDGKPDAVRGAKHLARIQATAQRMANQAVQPWGNALAQERSKNNFDQAVALKDGDGKPLVDHNLLRSAWMNVPAATTADPNYAAALVATVVGATMLNKKPTIQPPAHPALITEASGGRGSAPTRLSDSDLRIAKDRGKTEKQWSDLSKNFTPGRASTLED